MFYVYILKSIPFPEQIYIGYTNNLTQRLKTHNDGLSSHSAKYIPWEIVTYVALSDLDKAIAFEKYLKTSSGSNLLHNRLI